MGLRRRPGGGEVDALLSRARELRVTINVLLLKDRTGPRAHPARAPATDAPHRQAPQLRSTAPSSHAPRREANVAASRRHHFIIQSRAAARYKKRTRLPFKAGRRGPHRERASSSIARPRPQQWTVRRPVARAVHETSQSLDTELFSCCPTRRKHGHRGTSRVLSCQEPSARWKQSCEW